MFKYFLKGKNKSLKLNSFVLPVLAGAAISSGVLAVIIILTIIIVLELGFLIFMLLYYYFVTLGNCKNFKQSKVKEDEPQKLEEKPMAKEPQKIVESKPEVVKKEIKPIIVTEPTEGKNVKTIYNYSFQSRLHLADEETALRYNDLKNHLMSYEGVRVNKSWKQETFTARGKMVVKLRLQGKTMRVYLGVNPKDYVDTKYNIQDVSDKKTHETTPSLLVVRGPGILKHSMELIDQWMNLNEVNKKENYIEKNFKEKKRTREQLIKENLIKVSIAEFI